MVTFRHKVSFAFSIRLTQSASAHSTSPGHSALHPISLFFFAKFRCCFTYHVLSALETAPQPAAHHPRYFYYSLLPSPLPPLISKVVYVHRVNSRTASCSVNPGSNHHWRTAGYRGTLLEAGGAQVLSDRSVSTHEVVAEYMARIDKQKTAPGD